MTEHRALDSGVSAVDPWLSDFSEHLPAIPYVEEVGPGGGSTLRYVGPYVEATLGYTPAELVADRHLWATLIHPDDRARVSTARGQAGLAGLAGGRVDLEYRLVARDGNVVWFRDLAVLLDAGTDDRCLRRGLLIESIPSRDPEARPAAAERPGPATAMPPSRAAVALAEANSLDAVVRALAVLAAEAVGVACAEVHAFGATPAETVASGSVGVAPEPGPARVGDRPTPRAIPAEAEAIRSGRPLVRDPETAFPPDSPPPGWCGDLVVPLVADGETQGVLYVWEAGRPPRFADEEIALLRTIATQAGFAISRARDAAVVEGGVSRRRLLDRVARALAGRHDTEELCAIIHAEVSRVLPADAFFVALDEGEMVWVPFMVDEGVVSRGHRLRLDAGPTRHVLSSRRPYLATGGGDQVVDAGSVFGAPERRSESALYVPMVHGEQLIGVLSVQRDDPVAYDGDDLRTLEAIAGQAAAALHDASPLAAAQEAKALAERRAEYLELLNQIGRALAESLEVDRLCTTLHTEIAKVLPVDACYVALYEEGDTQLWFPYLADRDGRTVSNWQPLGDGPTSRVVRSRRSEVLAPDQPPPGGGGITFGAERHPGAALHVPMLRGERLVGVLSVQRDAPVAYDADDLRTLETIAGQAASAFAHARLYAATVDNRDAAARYAADRDAVLRISRAIASAPDLSAMLDVLAGELASLVPHDAIALYRLTPEGDSLRPIFSRQRGRDLDPGDWVLPVGVGLVGHAFVTGGAELVNDAHLDPRSVYPSDEAALRESDHHVVVAPLVVAGQRVGVLYLSRNAGPPFDREEFSFFWVLAEQAAAALRNAELLVRNRELYLGGILALASAVDAKDPYARGHSKRVSRLAGRIARARGLDPVDAEAVELAGLLHDIGKLGVPGDILRKPHPLDEAERAVMAQHAALGAEILGATGAEALAPLVPLVRHHHERLDGSGYPDGLSEGQIPLGAAILAVADAFDTMVTARPYRSARPVPEAIAELRRGSGRQFRADVVDALVAVVDEASVDGVDQVAGDAVGSPAPPGTDAPPADPSAGQMGDTRGLGLLVELANVTRHITDLPRFLRRVADIVRRRLGYQEVRLLLVDGERGEPLLAARARASGSRAVDPAGAVDAGVLREVLGSRRPQSGPISDPGHDESGGAADRGGATLVVPLIVEDRPIGVIAARAERADGLTAADEAVLTAAAGQLAAAIQVAQLHDAAKRAATTDGLTGLANHRAFYQGLEAAVAAGGPISVVLMDVEGLKEINDSLGHLAGDELLRRVARSIRAVAGKDDVVARYGGDEFGVVMRGVARHDAIRLADQVREDLRRADGDHGVTVRYGVATLPDDAAAPRDLVEIADRRLYAMRGPRSRSRGHGLWADARLGDDRGHTAGG